MNLYKHVFLYKEHTSERTRMYALMNLKRVDLMLRYFPVPYPDESIYNLYVRYDKKVGNNNINSSISELMGKRSSVDLYFCGKLDYLSSNLPTESGFTPEYFIQNHTLLPIFNPFVPSDRLSMAYENIKNGSLDLVQLNLGYRMGSICKSYEIKVCSKCIQEDRQTYGEAYIHRVHQVQGVFICYKHKEPLRETLFHRKPNLNALFDIETLSIKKETREYEIPTYLIDELYDLSCDVDFLIKNNELLGDFAIVKKKYNAKLHDAGFIAPGGSMHYQNNLHEAFLQHYRGDFLRMLESEVDVTSRHRSWLITLVRRYTNAVHPIRNLIFIRFLFGNLQNFVDYSKTERETFGSPPFPCLIGNTDHYGEKTITSFKRDNRRSNTQEVFGVFECEICKFSYTLKSSDFKKTGFSNFRINNFISEVDKEEIYKSVIVKLIEEEPEISRSEICFRLNKEFRWLRKHWREWIEQILPPKKEKHKSSVDWIKRDKEALLKVRQVVNAQLSREEKPLRLTRNRISQMTGIRDLIENQLENMPRSRSFLESIIEGQDEYYIRKVKWAANQLNLRSVRVKASKIKELCGLRTYSQSIVQEIEKQVHFYSNSK